MASELRTTDNKQAQSRATPRAKTQKDLNAADQRNRSLLLESLVAEMGYMPDSDTELMETFVRLILQATPSANAAYIDFIANILRLIRDNDEKSNETLRQIELDTFMIVRESSNEATAQAPCEHMHEDQTSLRSTMLGANLEHTFANFTQARSRSATHASVDGLSHREVPYAGSNSHGNPPSPPFMSGASSLMSERSKASELSPGLPRDSERRHRAEWGATLQSRLDTLGVQISNFQLVMPSELSQASHFDDISGVLAECAEAGSKVSEQDRKEILQHLLASAADLAGSSRLSRQDRCSRAADLLLNPLRVDEATGRVQRTRISITETTETPFRGALPFNKKAIQLNRQLLTMLLVLSYVRATPASLRDDISWCCIASTSLPQQPKPVESIPAAVTEELASDTLHGASPPLRTGDATELDDSPSTVSASSAAEFSAAAGRSPHDDPPVQARGRFELPSGYFNQHLQTNLAKAPLVLELGQGGRWHLQHLNVRSKELQTNCIVTGLVQNFRTSSQLQFLGADVRRLDHKTSRYHKLYQQQRAADKMAREEEHTADHATRQEERAADLDAITVRFENALAEQRQTVNSDLEAMTVRLENALAKQQRSCCVLQ